MPWAGAIRVGYITLCLGALTSLWIYGKWRERSLTPIAVPISLSEPGTYMVHGRGFHSSYYWPLFRVQVPFTTTSGEWYGQEFDRLWEGVAPNVRFRVLGRDGEEVATFAGTISDQGGWVASRGISDDSVLLYPDNGFRANFGGRYSVELQVVRGSTAASSYSSSFEIDATHSYALLPLSLAFLALLSASTAGGVAIFLQTRERPQARP